QDAVPTIRKFFHSEGFQTHITNEWESPSRRTELVAINKSVVVRIPWEEDQTHRRLMKFRAVLFDAAETLFTTRGSVGEIYGSVARRYGSQAPADVIQAAFAREFRGAGPLSVQDQARWWKDIVHRVFKSVGMVEDFDGFFH